MTKSSAVQVAPILVEGSISEAWSKAIVQVADHPGNEISPLILSVTKFEANGAALEDADLRAALDALLVKMKFRNVGDVAFTIFPQILWVMSQGNRAKLFAMYRDAFPRYQAMNRKDNKRGLYFERLTSYGSGPCDGNQLEWIISQYRSREGVRRSMFQASVFDPGRDHVNDAQLQFPCMQHMSFVPTADGLVVNAFYATQQLFVKAYGNYLGISQLAALMAQEMELKLARVNVIVGVAKLEKISKTGSDLAALLKAARACVASHKS